jgi:hypothetical protein
MIIFGPLEWMFDYGFPPAPPARATRPLSGKQRSKTKAARKQRLKTRRKKGG